MPKCIGLYEFGLCATLKVEKLDFSAGEPNIAVLLPVFNADDDLILTLDSLRAQTVPFRLFLVDDGSSKKTDYETLCQGIDAKIIRLPKNLGISGAMNMGIKHILEGKFAYVARIDAGDICKQSRFEKQLQFLELHSNIDILGSAVEFQQLDIDNKVLAERTVQHPTTPEGCLKRLYLNMPVSHPSLMIRRKVFEVLKSYSESFPAAEDYDLMWRATRSGFKLSNLETPLIIKIENPNSISQKFRRKQILSRLRIQWENFNGFNLQLIFGMLRSLIVLAAPKQLISIMKSILG